MQPASGMSEKRNSGSVIHMKTAPGRVSSRPAHTAATVLGALVLAALPAAAPTAVLPAAHAAPAAPAADDGQGLDAAADALAKGPVYVDPRARKALPSGAADALARDIEGTGKPVFVAVLPATSDYPPDPLFQDLRTRVGIRGVYAIQLGDRFDARADPQVMSRDAVRNLVGTVRRAHPGGGAPLLRDFAAQAARQAQGHAPDSWHGPADDGVGSGTLVGVGVLVVIGAGGAYTFYRRSQRSRAAEERAALESLRAVVDEDITAFGEELDRLDFRPGEPGADDAMRADYGRALDAYEEAKRAMAEAERPADVRAVTEALESGRFALATLAARREGRTLPERRPPCFFDPRHGPSVADAYWAPPGGAERTVPVCAADRARLADGQEPMARTVRTAHGEDRPYWDAGPVYAPWAGGYFGGGLLPGLLVGTVLGTSLAGPAAYASDGSYFPGDEGTGGDYSGADFDPDDFSGGFGGGYDGGGGFGGDGGGFGGGFGN